MASDDNDPATWIDKFLPRYRTRFDPFDWPAAGDDEWLEFVGTWVAAFRRNGVTLGEANAAALQLAEYPPTYRNQHLPAVLEVVRSNRKPQANPIDATAAERAKRQREAMARVAIEDRLTAKWQALPGEVRETIRAEVIAENPGLAKWDHFVASLCLARLQEVRA